MNQASRIIAQWNGVSDVIGHERIACSSWKRAVGKKVAQHTRALKLVRNALVIEVEDEIWRSNLWSLRSHILRNLDKALGPGIVTSIELRVMPPRFGAQRETESSFALHPPQLDEADQIADPGIRRIYKAARRRETA
jgi:predicted nucleic acid-binding Zn ribbon protein